MKQRASGLVFQMLVWMVAGSLQQNDLLVIDYLREENRVLREQLGATRLRLTDEQRRRLAVRAEPLGRAVLRSVATLVSPETLLGWYRRLVAQQVRWQPWSPGWSPVDQGRNDRAGASNGA